MQRIERPFEARIRREITRASREIVAAFKLTGEVIQPRDHVENMTAIYQAMAIASFQAFGARVMDQGKAARQRHLRRHQTAIGSSARISRRP